METWKPVPGYDGYEVSDQGRIRSLDRVVLNGGAEHRVRGKMLRFTSVKGYQRVSLNNDEGRWQTEAHRVVLLAFVGPCPEGMQGCHNNGDPTDNRLENLRWDTVSENALDRVRHETHHYSKRTECPQGHPYDEENTYVNPANNQRVCKECQRTYLREYMREYRKGKRRRAAAVDSE